MDTLPVLSSADGRLACKAHYRTRGALTTETHIYGELWHMREEPISSLADLVPILERLRSDRYSCVVRGRPRDTRLPSRRNLETLESVPRQWVMLDFDSVDSPSPAALHASLPAPWSQTACYWHASGNAGFKPGLRVHFWYWLDRPLPEEELTRWFASETLGVYHLDCTLFRPAQVHYTADPLIGEGVQDPMSERAGLLPGNPELPTPAAEVLRLLPTPKQFKAAERELKTWCKSLAETAEGGRANACNRAAYFLGKASILPDAQIVNALLDAARATGLDAAEAMKHIERGLHDGRALKEQHRAEPWRAGLRVSETDGRIESCLSNFLKILQNHQTFAEALAYNTRTHQIQVVEALPWRGKGPVEDSDAVALREWFEVELDMRLSRQDAWDILVLAAKRRAYDPFMDWLLPLKWDGTPRLRHLHSLFNVATSPYSEATFRWWMISAVARALNPGCQVDHMLVLQSAEHGWYKSSAFKELVPFEECYATLPAKGHDLNEKDNVAKLHGPVIVCIEEMAAFRGRASDVVKHFITERVDRFRPPYGRATVDHPRANVFVGNTNEDVFISDPTGGRRFWPHIVLAPIDTSAIIAAREQLWAEALHEYRAGARWWPTPEEADSIQLKAAQSARREATPLEDILAEVLQSPRPGVLRPEQIEGGRVLYVTTQQLQELTGQDLNRHNRELAGILKVLGFVKNNNVTPRVWRRVK